MILKEFADYLIKKEVPYWHNVFSEAKNRKATLLGCILKSIYLHKIHNWEKHSSSYYSYYKDDGRIIITFSEIKTLYDKYKYKEQIETANYILKKTIGAKVNFLGHDIPGTTPYLRSYKTEIIL